MESLYILFLCIFLGGFAESIPRFDNHLDFIQLQTEAFLLRNKRSTIRGEKCTEKEDDENYDKMRDCFSENQSGLAFAIAQGLDLHV